MPRQRAHHFVAEQSEPSEPCALKWNRCPNENHRRQPAKQRTESPVSINRSNTLVGNHGCITDGIFDACFNCPFVLCRVFRNPWHRSLYQFATVQGCLSKPKRANLPCLPSADPAAEDARRRLLGHIHWDGVAVQRQVSADTRCPVLSVIQIYSLFRNADSTRCLEMTVDISISGSFHVVF